MARKRGVYTIDKPEQLAALASPVRHVILDALTAADTPCSVARIAELVGRPPDSLYYHLRSLEKVALVRQVRRTDSAQRDTAYYTVPAAGMRIRYDFSSPGFRKNIVRMISAMLRATERDFSKAAQERSACGSGKHRDTWAGRVELRLTRTQLERVNALVRDLLELQYADTPPQRSKRFALTLALAPIPDRGRAGESKRE